MGQGGDFPDNNHSSHDGEGHFSADLKGDFANSFGSASPGQGSFFKDGGGGNKKRLFILLAVLLVLAGLAAYFVWYPSEHSSDESSMEASEGGEGGEDEFSLPEEEVGDQSGSEPAVGQDASGKKDEEAKGDSHQAAESLGGEHTSAALKAPPLGAAKGQRSPKAESAHSASMEQPYLGSQEDGYTPAATVAPTLVSPQDGYERSYDETAEAADFSWEGSPGGWIFFSRNPSMQPVEMKRKVRGNGASVRKLYPGTWYWQIRNGAGRSGIRSFVVKEPVARVLSLASPQEGGSLAGTGGIVSWTGDSKVSYYRVEISNNGWANPMYRFATSGTQLQINNVAAGQYDLRLGAFSEVSGRWEYTQAIKITVQ